MSLKIDASSLFSRHYLVLQPGGFKYLEDGMIWGARRIGFGEVRCVLMSETHHLSFQVGNEVFTIPTKPGRTRHQAAIAEFLEGVRNSVRPSASGPTQLP